MQQTTKHLLCKSVVINFSGGGGGLTQRFENQNFKSLFTLEKMERFHTSSVNMKRFQMVSEVIKIEEEGVLNHINPVFCGIWRVKKQSKHRNHLSLHSCSLLER